MNCVTSVSYPFNVNGEKIGFVKPQRGIRQDDPLSPYLFLFCAEGLCSLLYQVAQDKKITGIRISRNGPKLSHLFFVDVSLIFCRVDAQEIEEMRRILAVYESASEQQINVEKSSILFSKNMKPDQRKEIIEDLGGM